MEMHMCGELLLGEDLQLQGLAMMSLNPETIVLYNVTSSS